MNALTQTQNTDHIHLIFKLLNLDFIKFLESGLLYIDRYIK